MNTSERRVNEEIKALLTGSGRETTFVGTVKEGFGRKFTVINESDIEKYVPKKFQENLNEALNEALDYVEDGRMQDGKQPGNNYIVINLDEPYTDKIIEIMKRHGHWG